MDPRSKIYNTKLTKEEVISLFEDSFKCSLGDISDMFEWKSDVLEQLSENSEILIGEALKFVEVHNSSKLGRYSNTPVVKFRENVKKFYKNIPL